jgi:hypothetical protein
MLSERRANRLDYMKGIFLFCHCSEIRMPQMCIMKHLWMRKLSPPHPPKILIFKTNTRERAIIRLLGSLWQSGVVLFMPL